MPEQDYADTLLEAKRMQGQQTCREADSILSRKIYFGNKYKDAVIEYKNAAEHFMSGEDSKSAIECLKKAYDCMEKKPKEFKVFDRAELLMEMAEYQKEEGIRETENFERLIQWISQASILYAESGHFYKAACVEKELAKYLEEEGPFHDGSTDKPQDAAEALTGAAQTTATNDENRNFLKAIDHYKNAGEMFDVENHRSSSNECFLKVAELSALVENYEQSIKYFELVAEKCTKEKLTAFVAREHLLKALICHFLLQMQRAEHDDLTGFQAFSDLEDTKLKFERYCEMDIHLEGSMEGELVMALIRAIEKKNPREMSTILKKFDKLQKLDTWKTTLLLKIKDKITEIDLT